MKNGIYCNILKIYFYAHVSYSVAIYYCNVFSCQKLGGCIIENLGVELPLCGDAQDELPVG